MSVCCMLTNRATMGSKEAPIGVDSMSDDALLTVEKVAEILDVHIKTVRAYIASGELAAIKLKRDYRISRTDLDNFIRQRRTDRKPSEPD
jgi:excisionase family DNA binding protein